MFTLAFFKETQPQGIRISGLTGNFSVLNGVYEITRFDDTFLNAEYIIPGFENEAPAHLELYDGINSSVGAEGVYGYINYPLNAAPAAPIGVLLCENRDLRWNNVRNLETFTCSTDMSTDMTITFIK